MSKKINLNEIIDNIKSKITSLLRETEAAKLINSFGFYDPEISLKKIEFKGYIQNINYTNVLLFKVTLLFKDLIIDPKEDLDLDVFSIFLYQEDEYYKFDNLDGTKYVQTFKKDDYFQYKIKISEINYTEVAEVFNNTIQKVFPETKPVEYNFIDIILKYISNIEILKTFKINPEEITIDPSLKLINVPFKQLGFINKINDLYLNFVFNIPENKTIFDIFDEIDIYKRTKVDILISNRKISFDKYKNHLLYNSSYVLDDSKTINFCFAHEILNDKINYEKTNVAILNYFNDLKN